MYISYTSGINIYYAVLWLFFAKHAWINDTNSNLLTVTQLTDVYLTLYTGSVIKSRKHIFTEQITFLNGQTKRRQIILNNNKLMYK